jgi:subtilisin family serine protease
MAFIYRTANDKFMTRMLYFDFRLIACLLADTYGHGTHVAGIIAGSGKNSTASRYFYTFKGIAPNVNLVNLRVLDKNGQGTDSWVIAAGNN